MKNKGLFLSFLFCLLSSLEMNAQTDWLLDGAPYKSFFQYDPRTQQYTLSNGLVKRSFYKGPNMACVGYLNLTTNQELLRAISPEAILFINGIRYAVGGLQGQSEKAYLQPQWLSSLKAGTNDFIFTKVETEPLTPRIKTKYRFWSGAVLPYKGLHVKFSYSHPQFAGLEVVVHYELFDGAPLIVKWIGIENNSDNQVYLNRVENEVLGLVEEESAVVGKPTEMKKQHGIYLETNYAFNNAMRYDISDQTTHWNIDSTYTSQVNYNYETPCLLEVYPEKAPGITLAKGERFESVRTHELLMDGYDRERRGMAIRKMYRTVAPWTQMNPIFMHLVSSNDEQVKIAIDQCLATGYEAVILSFGSHLNMEDTSAANLNRWKNLADYAHQKGIALGGYSLFSSRRISDEDDVIDAKTGKPGGAFFGNAPCFGSKWGLAYRDKIKNFFKYTGFDIWENDGPYPGDQCASTVHPGHKNLDDSQWLQMEIQKELYRWLNEKGVYINAPDWYFMDGTHKIAIGYREVNFSLSREQQKILNRQNINDGTFEKTPAMGWGFVPLTRYQGGGPEAILEPLSEHLADYKQLMFQYYGAGVQACYRGPRLYDTDTTRKVVAEMIAWYKKYRDLLNQDIVHLRRADGRDWDGWMHVQSSGYTRGIVLLFNPTSTPMKKKIKIPLYYTGLQATAIVSKEGKSSKLYSINKNSEIEMEIELAPLSYSWWTIQKQTK